MSPFRILSLAAVAALAYVATSCSPSMTLTSFKNPENKNLISSVAVIPLFDKLEFIKPFEQSMAGYFNKHGLTAYGSLQFLNPEVKYPVDDVKRKCDSMGVDAIVLVLYRGTDKSESYIPPTTYYSGGYGGYGGYWGGGYWGGGYYGGAWGGTMVTTTGGYWTTTSIVHLTVKVYTKGHQDVLWTGEVSVEDPKYVDQAAHEIARNVYAQWKKDQVLKVVPKK